MSQSAEAPEILALIAQLKKGEIAALEKLIELTQLRLYRYCFHLCGDQSKAEELAQDTYLKIFDQIKNLTKPEGLYSWLFTITRHLFIDRTRTAEYKIENLQSHATEENEILDFIPSQFSGETIEDAVFVREALMKLTPVDRQLLILTFYEGFSGEEAAKILGISPGAVRVRVHRAKAAFIAVYQSEKGKGDKS